MKIKYNGKSLKIKLSKKQIKTLNEVIEHGQCDPGTAPCCDCPLKYFTYCDRVLSYIEINKEL